MKYHYLTVAIQAWRTVVISLFLSLYGCGGEEPASTTPTHVYSSLLTDNTVLSGSNFANFKLKKVTIDPSALPLSGSRIFLKLSRQTGDVLFLGEIERFHPFHLEVDLLLDDKSLSYELFSNDASDTTQSGVIPL